MATTGSASANASKSPYLAAAEHLASWRRHLTTNGELLEEVARAHRWPTQPEATLGVARAIYLRLGPGVPLWVRGRSFDPSDPELIRLALAG